MKSIRDLVKKMPETRQGLEDIVLRYNPHIREKVESDKSAQEELRKESGNTMDKYGKYMGGWTQKLSATGHAVGHSADAWLVTGDMVGSLGGKFLHLLAQVPDKVYGLAYGAKTGNYIDGLKNLFQGILSYAPGFTTVDEGLSRIVQKRMVKDLTYKMEEKLGLEHKTWDNRLYDKLRADENYTGVKNRKENVVRAYSSKKGPVDVEITPEGNIKPNFKKDDREKLSKRKVA